MDGEEVRHLFSHTHHYRYKYIYIGENVLQVLKEGVAIIYNYNAYNLDAGESKRL